MKIEISVPEIVNVFKEIQQQPEKLFNMIRTEIRENVGQYLSRGIQNSPIFLDENAMSTVREM